jgi:hypothetical protein
LRNSACQAIYILFDWKHGAVSEQRNFIQAEGSLSRNSFIPRRPHQNRPGSQASADHFRCAGYAALAGLPALAGFFMVG